MKLATALACLLFLVACASGHVETLPAKRPASVNAERSALLVLYALTDGPNWKLNNGWGGPPGTECEWEGVFCDYANSELTVIGLHLGDNHLTGHLPDEIGQLANLSEFLVHGNRMSGAAPSGLLAKFDSGQLRFLGYAGQFSPVSEIRLKFQVSAELCGDYEATIRLDGSATLSRKFCRNSSDEDRGTFWETKTGFINRYAGDFDRLARLSETSRLSEISGSYRRNITHGNLETITVIRSDRAPIVIEDYAESAPAPIWLMKRAIAGVLFNAEWESSTRSEVVLE